MILHPSNWFAWMKLAISVCSDWVWAVLNVASNFSSIGRRAFLTANWQIFGITIIPTIFRCHWLFHLHDVYFYRVKRMELVLDFLREGTDIILSDTDAIWRRNPFPDLAQYAFKPSKILASSSDTGATTASTIIPPSDIIAVCTL